MDNHEKTKVDLRSIDDSTGLPYIDCHELSALIKEKSPDELCILDCRFDYEFNAGHIKGAQNIISKKDVHGMLFELPKRNITIIVHCEFSQHRGPKIAAEIREVDRKMNIFRYPELTYPNLYILKDGFKAFYEAHEDDCCGIYLPMKSEMDQCEVKLAKWNNENVKPTVRHTLRPSPIAIKFGQPRVLEMSPTIEKTVFYRRKKSES